jgi:hypothetical protein
MAIIGVILLIIEISEPGFFIAIPGTILIVIGIIAMIFPGIFFDRLDSNNCNSNFNTRNRGNLVDVQKDCAAGKVPDHSFKGFFNK